MLHLGIPQLHYWPSVYKGEISSNGPLEQKVYISDILQHKS